MLGLYISLGVIALLLPVWLFLIGAVHDKRMDKYRGVYFAHRGLHGSLDIYPDAAPENSLKAFARAVEQGYGIELDVRLTSDGELVVFHDDTLTRVTGVDRKVRELTLAELRELSLLGTEERIPLFSEVLELVDGKVPLLVEIKEDGTDLTTARQAVKTLESYRGDYIIESFNPLSLGAVKKANPTVLRGFLCDKLTAQEAYRSIKYRVVQRHLLNFIARPSFIASNFKTSRMLPIPVIRALFRPAFVAWTIRSAEEEREAASRGFTTMIFEGYIPDREPSDK